MGIAQRLIGHTGPGLALQELLYGVIMAMIFIIAAQTGIVHFESSIHVVGAIVGMNTAWGIVDMVTFTIVGNYDQKKYTKIISERSAMNREGMIEDNLTGTIVDVLLKKDRERIIQEISASSVGSEQNLKRGRKDILESSVSSFILTIMSAIPIILPLIFIENMHLALTISSIMATVMFFFIGFYMSKYSGVNKWLSGFAFMSIGLIITVVTTFMGG